MKIKVEVDLGELYSDEEDSLQESITQYIKAQVIHEVWNKVRESVNTQITNQVKDEVNNQVRARVSAHIDGFLANGLLNPGTPMETKIITFLHDQIANTRAWQSIGPNLSKVAENYAKDVQQKYDVLFATNIVMKLKDNGMLVHEKLQQLFGGES